MSVTLQFTPWTPFHARKSDARIQSWLQDIAHASEAAFKQGASRPWPGGDASGSSSGEWPMRRSGRLLGTIGTEVSATEVTVGSNAQSPRGFDYSSWLQKTGRKMSREALKEGMASAGHLTRWVEWSQL